MWAGPMQLGGVRAPVTKRGDQCHEFVRHDVGHPAEPPVRAVMANFDVYGLSSPAIPGLKAAAAAVGRIPRGICRLDAGPETEVVGPPLPGLRPTSSRVGLLLTHLPQHVSGAGCSGDCALPRGRTAVAHRICNDQGRSGQLKHFPREPQSGMNGTGHPAMLLRRQGRRVLRRRLAAPRLWVACSLNTICISLPLYRRCHSTGPQLVR